MCWSERIWERRLSSTRAVERGRGKDFEIERWSENFENKERESSGEKIRMQWRRKRDWVLLNKGKKVWPRGETRRKKARKQDEAEDKDWTECGKRKSDREKEWVWAIEWWREEDNERERTWEGGWSEERMKTGEAKRQHEILNEGEQEGGELN